MTNQQVNYVIYRSLMDAYSKFVSGLVTIVLFAVKAFNFFQKLYLMKVGFLLI